MQLLRHPYAKQLQTAADRDLASPAVRPAVVLLDRNHNIVAAEPAALRLLAGQLPKSARIGEDLKALCQEIVSEDNGSSFALGTAELEIVSLEGQAGPYYAILVKLGVRNVSNVGDAAERFGLTKREAEVLSLIVSGQRGSEIARMLCISLATVNDHFKSLRRKIGARSRSEMLIKVLGIYSEIVPTRLP
ncbi:MAG TPA: helix-turn-helix transcriptional regulator [Candidatus Babeliales bacterium]|nr:helix-turn-helix transcriptional regulator [Candidatus Babeliales bacterium]